MKKVIWYYLTIVTMFALTACTTNEPTTPENEIPPTEEPSDENTGNEGQEAANFDSQIEETIELEGMEETITLNLYDNETAPFITYVPTDFVAEEASGGEGDSYWFYANYGDEKVEEVNVHVYFYSETRTEAPNIEDEDSTFTLLVGNMAPVSENEKIYDWAIEEYQSPEGSRRAMLGEHEGQYFVIVLNSTVEYSEGFYPRANKIIDHFYWRDTEEYLADE